MLQLNAEFMVTLNSESGLTRDDALALINKKPAQASSLLLTTRVILCFYSIMILIVVTLPFDHGYVVY